MIRVSIDSSRPIFIEADADSFGKVFASADSAEQIAILRAMAEHMKPHRTQWDYISMEMDKPENAELREAMRIVLFPSVETEAA